VLHANLMVLPPPAAFPARRSRLYIAPMQKMEARLPPKPLTTPWSAIVKANQNQQDAAGAQPPAAHQVQAKEAKPSSSSADLSKDAVTQPRSPVSSAGGSPKPATPAPAGESVAKVVDAEKSAGDAAREPSKEGEAARDGKAAAQNGSPEAKSTEVRAWPSSAS